MTLLSLFVTTRYYKKVLIAMCLCVAVFADSGFVVGQGLGNGDQEQICFVKKSLREPASTEVGFEYFNEFIVPLKDCDRKDRILICDVAIELNQGMKLPKERIGLRKIIYKIFKEQSGLSEIRKGLKETIKIKLNNFMDDETIKKVYFTKLILL
ncbi:MAG: flagellar basal body-associated FliL family protein [Deltaproteobacteria bacterium]|nr:flagellar basal body-associated FliL family protein [Deltaproteobacteria bacterium]